MKAFLLAKWRVYPKWLLFVSAFMFLLIGNSQYDLASVSYFEFVFLQTNGYNIISFLLLSFVLPLSFVYLSGDEDAIEILWLQKKKYLSYIVSNLLYCIILGTIVLLLYMACSLFVYIIFVGSNAAFSNTISPFLQNQDHELFGSLYASLSVNMICLLMLIVVFSIFSIIINILLKKSWGLISSCIAIYVYYQFRINNMSLLHNKPDLIVKLLNTPFGAFILLCSIVILCSMLYLIIRFDVGLKSDLPRTCLGLSIGISIILICVTYIIHFKFNISYGLSYSLAGINMFSAMCFPMPFIFVFNDMASFIVALSCLPIYDSTLNNALADKRSDVLQSIFKCGVIGSFIFICSYILLLVGCIIYTGHLFLPAPISIGLFRNYTCTSWSLCLLILFVNGILYGLLFGALAYLVTRYLKPKLRPAILMFFPMFEMLRNYIQTLFYNKYINALFPIKMIELPSGIYVWQRLLNFAIFIVLILILYCIYMHKNRTKRIEASNDYEENPCI